MLFFGDDLCRTLSFRKQFPEFIEGIGSGESPGHTHDSDVVGEERRGRVDHHDVYSRVQAEAICPAP